MTHLGICTLRKQGNNPSEHYDSLSLLIKNSSHEQPHVMKLNCLEESVVLPQKFITFKSNAM